MGKGLSDASDLMVSGCSAGGLATYLHTDQWCDAFPKAKCAGLPDSGFFLVRHYPTGIPFNSTTPGCCCHGPPITGAPSLGHCWWSSQGQ